MLLLQSDCNGTERLRSMENFISGYPGCEFQIREALAEVIGSEKSELFFDKVLIAASDAHPNTEDSNLLS